MQNYLDASDANILYLLNLDCCHKISVQLLSWNILCGHSITLRTRISIGSNTLCTCYLACDLEASMSTQI